MKIKRLVGKAVMLVALGVGMTTTAHAGVVTFDSHPTLQFASTSDGGLDFASGSGVAYIFGAVSPNSNGTPNLILGFGPNDSVTITKTGGGLFDLNSIDMAISWYANTSADVITINGDALTITDKLTTYNLGLLGVSSVTITGYRVVLDTGWRTTLSMTPGACRSPVRWPCSPWV